MISSSRIALVGLRTPEPVANTGDRPAQSRIKSSQRRDRVFGGEVQRRPAFVLAQGWSESERLVLPLHVPELGCHPVRRLLEELSRSFTRCDAGRYACSKASPDEPEVRLTLELSQQAFAATGLGHLSKQREQTRAVHLLSQAARRGIFQVMGLIDHKVIEVRKQPRPRPRHPPAAAND